MRTIKNMKFIDTEEQGFTLLEILTSLAIMAIVMTPFMKSIGAQLLLRNSGSMAYQASVAAQSVLDEYQFKNIKTLPTSGRVLKKVEAGDVTLNVETTFCEKMDFCPENNIRHLAVRVYFSDELLYTTSSVFSSYN